MAHFAVAVPGLHTVVTIDDVEAERQRVDDARGQPPFHLDLMRRARNLTREPVDIFGVGQLRREEICHDREYLPGVLRQRTSAAYRENANALSHRDQATRHDATVTVLLDRK